MRKHPLPSYIWRAYHRTVNRWRDVKAFALGYCAARPAQGGYAHWRCALRRGHGETHRYNNYVWSDGGRTEYAPIDTRADFPWSWFGTPTLRAQRARDRWHAEQAARHGSRSARWWAAYHRRESRAIFRQETRDWIMGK